MSKVVYVHAHGQWKAVENVTINNKGEVKKSDVINAINKLFNQYDKKIRDNQIATVARDKAIRFVKQATRVSGKPLGQNVYTTGSFNQSDMKNYHIDIEFDTEVSFI
jgi:phosphoribosyl-dephospho-CoA transferase